MCELCSSRHGHFFRNRLKYPLNHPLAHQSDPVPPFRMARYFLLDRGIRRGPYSERRLLAKLDAGEVSGDCLCTAVPDDEATGTVEEEAWLPLSSVIGPAFVSATSAAPRQNSTALNRSCSGSSTSVRTGWAPRSYSTRRPSSRRGRHRRSGSGSPSVDWTRLVGGGLVLCGALLAAFYLLDQPSSLSASLENLDPAVLKLRWKSEIIERLSGMGAGLALAVCGTVLLSSGRLVADPFAERVRSSDR